MLCSLVASLAGGAAIAVPGEVLGLYEAWKMFGRLPWADLVQPSIVLARDGAEVSAFLGNWTNYRKEVILENPMLRFVGTNQGFVQGEFRGRMGSDSKLGLIVGNVAQ